MSPRYRPRIVLPEPPADDKTWRVLLSLPGRVAIIDETATNELVKLARSTFGAGRDDERAAA